MLKSKIVSVCKGPETLMTQSAVVPKQRVYVQASKQP